MSLTQIFVLLVLIIPLTLVFLDRLREDVAALRGPSGFLIGVGFKGQSRRHRGGVAWREPRRAPARRSTGRVS